MSNTVVFPQEVKQNVHMDFCYEILPDVSRTFALTIPALGKPLADSVCVAYLLCRIADTIEDRNDLEFEHRQWLYSQFATLVSDAMTGKSVAVDAFMDRWPRESNADYQRLMEGMSSVLRAFSGLAPADLEPVNACVQEMVEGMRTMTHRPPTDGVVYVADSLETLEQYCHYVAGTVGLMLTRLFGQRIDSFEFATAKRLEQGRRFGLGLQLTNILKDQVGDLERGTSFMPREWLDATGRLKAPERKALILRTLDHLDEAHAYAMALPAQCEGMRLFCMWASWMAVATMREVAAARSERPKIGRAEVTTIIAYTRQHVRNDGKLDERFGELKKQAHAALR